MLALVWLTALLGAACGRHEEPGDASPQARPGQDLEGPSGCAPVARQTETVDCSRIGHIGLAGVAQRLNTGIEVAVRLESASGEPLSAGIHGACLHRLRPDDCTELGDMRASARPADGALTALLVAPGSSAESAALAMTVVEAFLAARPASERVGIYRWGASVHQVSSFTTDRDVAMRLARRGLVGSTEQRAAPELAVDTVRRELGALSWGAFVGVRAIVIVAPELALQAPLPRTADIVEIWGVAPGTVATGPNIVALDEDTAAAALSSAVSAHVDAGLVQLAWCSSGSPERILIQPHHSTAERLVDTPAALPEEAHMQCSLETLDAPLAYPDRLEIVFANDEQRQIYQERVATQSKDDFDAQLRLWPDGAVVDIVAHLRGSSSLECERKNYAFNIDGKQARRLMPGSAMDEFVISSMCEDDRYLSHDTAMALLSRLGLFPVGHRLIELVIDGQHQGVYMLMENPKDGLLHDNSRMRGLVRRNSDLEDEPPEGKYGYISKLQALNDYQAFMSAIEQAAPDELVATAEAGMDIDQYLRWLAFMSLVGNGDYSDEAYFISTETLAAHGTELRPADFYTVMAWDPEDLFQPCHHDGQFAVDDPEGMLVCAEARIDHAMFANEDMYARYVAVLASVLDAVPQSLFDQAVDDTVARLDTYFRKDEVRAGMVEIIRDNPDAVTYEGIMEDVHEREVEMKAAFAENQARLREAVDSFTSSHAGR